MQVFAVLSLLLMAVEAQSNSQSTSDCDIVCLAILDPVCASNGETFGNKCEFSREQCISGDDTLEIVSKGACTTNETSANGDNACLQEFMCLDVYIPVCGSDGQTYSNSCVLKRAQCSDVSLELDFEGECAAPSASNTPEPESSPSVPTASNSKNDDANSKKNAACTTS